MLLKTVSVSKRILKCWDMEYLSPYIVGKMVGMKGKKQDLTFYETSWNTSNDGTKQSSNMNFHQKLYGDKTGESKENLDKYVSEQKKRQSCNIQ